MSIIRFLLLIIHLAVAGLLVGCLLNAYIPPHIFPWLNFLSLAFPVLMGMHMVLTLIWMISWKKRAFLFLLLSVLFFNPARRWINYNPKPKEGGEIKVITLNGKGGKEGDDKLNDYFQEQQADVILLQEYQAKEGSGGTVIHEPIISLVSRHPILKHENLNISGDNGQSFYADIDLHGKTVRFINIYLEPFYLKKSMVKPNKYSQVNEEKAKILISKMTPQFRIHEQQVKEIKAFAEKSPYPVIMGGDCNSVPNSYEYYHLSKNMKDAFVEVGNGSATSFHDYKFPIRIDYLYCSKNITPVSYRVDRSLKLSDHFPVIATFDLK